LDLVLLPRFGAWRIGAIDEDAIAKLIRDLQREGLHAIDPARPVRPLSASSVINHLKPLGQTLAFAVRNGYPLQSNPLRNLERDERPKQENAEPAHEWTDEEIEALLSASAALANEETAQYDYTPLLRTAIYTGLRLGELLGLQWQDVDGNVLHVRRQWALVGEVTEPKTRKGLRRVPLSPDLVALLRRHRMASRFSQETDFVFASRAGTPLQHRNVQRRGFELARDKAKLPETLTFHDLRHAFASLAAHRGVPLTVLSEVLGHADTSITQRVYTHLYGREQAEEAFRAAMAGGAS
jgi:integrase